MKTGLCLRPEGAGRQERVEQRDYGQPAAAVGLGASVHPGANAEPGE